MSAKPQPRTEFNKLMTQVQSIPEWSTYGTGPASAKAFKAALLRILGAHGWTRKSFLKMLDKEGWPSTTAMRNL